MMMMMKRVGCSFMFVRIDIQTYKIWQALIIDGFSKCNKISGPCMQACFWRLLQIFVVSLYQTY